MEFEEQHLNGFSEEPIHTVFDSLIAKITSTQPNQSSIEEQVEGHYGANQHGQSDTDSKQVGRMAKSSSRSYSCICIHLYWNVGGLI